MGPGAAEAQSIAGSFLFPLAAGCALVSYDPKLAIVAGGLTLAVAAVYKKDWRWWIAAVLILAAGLLFQVPRPRSSPHILNAQMLSYDGPYLPTVSRYATPTEIDWVKADTPARKLGTNREARMVCTWSTSMIRTDGGAPVYLPFIRVCPIRFGLAWPSQRKTEARIC